MRRLRVGGDVPCALGRPWVAVRAHYGALPLAAGRVRAKVGESLPDDGCEARAQYPEARPQGQKSRGGAPDGGVARLQLAGVPAERIAKITTISRRQARCHPSCFRRGHRFDNPEHALAGSYRRGCKPDCLNLFPTIKMHS
jgi:hypothetical protein